MRTIRVAYVEQNGVSKKENIPNFLRGRGFDIRKEYNKNLIKFRCCECQELLTISYHGKTVYLKHYPNSIDCILKETKADEELIESIYEVHLSRESPRHLYLKEELIEKLKITKGITNIESEQFKFNGKERRKPDVFCHFNNHKIAFEIQLSKISQKYIFYREKFYKELGIYLFWILDDFTKNSQNHTDKDIKYLNKYEHILELNVQNDASIFICNYKEPFIYANKSIRTKWNKSYVNLDDLLFDDEDLSFHYFDIEAAKRERNKELQKIKKLQREQELKWEEERAKQRRILNRIENEIQSLETVKEEYEDKRRDLNWTKGGLKSSIESKKELLLIPRTVIEKMIEEGKYSFRLQRFKEKIENKNNFEEAKKVFEETNSKEREISKIQMKINSIDKLQTVQSHGMEFKLIDQEENKDYILRNRKKFAIAYSYSLASKDFKFVRETNKMPLEKMIHKKQKYTFLFRFKTDLQKLKSTLKANDKLLKEYRQNYLILVETLKEALINWSNTEIQDYRQSLEEVESQILKNEDVIKSLDDKIELLKDDKIQYEEY